MDRPQAPLGSVNVRGRGRYRRNPNIRSDNSQPEETIGRVEKEGAHGTGDNVPVPDDTVKAVDVGEEATGDFTPGPFDALEAAEIEQGSNVGGKTTTGHPISGLIDALKACKVDQGSNVGGLVDVGRSGEEEYAGSVRPFTLEDKQEKIGVRGAYSQGAPPKATVAEKPIPVEHGETISMPMTEPVENPPKLKGPGTCEARKILTTVNSYEAKIDPVPEGIYQHDIVIELNKESQDRRAANKKARNEREARPARPGNGPSTGLQPGSKIWKKIITTSYPHICKAYKEPVATDFSKVMYTRTLEHREYSFSVRMQDIEGGASSSRSQDVYDITIKLCGADGGVSERVMLGDSAREFLTNTKVWAEKENGTAHPRATDIERIYNIVLRTSCNLDMISVGRAAVYDGSFTPQSFNLGGGLFNASGYNLIFSLGWKPYVNIDCANAAFYKPISVIEALNELKRDEKRYTMDPTNVSRWDKDKGDFKTAINFLKSCKVSYSTGKGTTLSGKIAEIMEKPASENEFTSTDGITTNVQAYFQATYGINLQHPKGVCLNLGSSQNKRIVPAELCTIEPKQNYVGSLTANQTSAMIKDTAKKPARRLEETSRALNELGLIDPKSRKMEVLKNFGLKIRPKLFPTDTRVLKQPNLVYGMLNVVTPLIDGTWGTPTRELISNNRNSEVVFYSTKKEKVKWGILNIYAGRSVLEQDELKPFVNAFRDKARSKGLSVGNPEYYKKAETKEITLKRREEFFGPATEKGLTFLLVVLPNKNEEFYSHIKSMCECTQDEKPAILTQCVLQQNVRKNTPAIVTKVVEKLNHKLGGINYVLESEPEFERIDMLRCPMLIIGADVTHPPPGSDMPISFAAVTGSTDRTGMSYQCALKAQARPLAEATEVIDGLEAILLEMMETFYKNTECFPEAILYFRDGVGDSQFHEVLDREKGAMDRANKKWVAKYPKATKPKVTFVAVQKRHKVRIYPNNPEKDGVGKICKNAPPGTVVDKDIVSCHRPDFYLLSHTGIQGTSKPTRYQLLWDEVGFTVDELQKLTLNMCYMYCRTTRSVSYPAPTYYAHLGAKRAKNYALGYRKERDEEGLATNWREMTIENVNKSLKRNANFVTTFPMHFV